MSKINLKDNTWYITAGDYLVYISEDDCGGFYASLETSPGNSISGRPAKNIYEGKHGWYYNDNGIVEGLKSEWCEKLRIVAECTNQIKLPEGYEWLGGFPRLYLGKDIINQYIIRDNGRVEKNNVTCFFESRVFGKKRIGLVKKDDVPSEKPKPELQLAVGKWYVTKGDYLVFLKSENFNNTVLCASVETSPGATTFGTPISKIQRYDNKGWGYCKTNYGRITGLSPEWCEKLEIVAEYPHPVILPDGYAWKDGFPKLYSAKDLQEDYLLSLVGTAVLPGYSYSNFDACNIGTISDKRIGLVKVDKPVEPSVPVPVPIVESKEEEMKKETAIAAAKVAGNLGFRALNYWLFEPAVNTFRPVVKGVRYAVFLSTLASAVYGYRHPDVVKNAIMSCLPKISVEAPEILK